MRNARNVLLGHTLIEYNKIIVVTPIFSPVSKLDWKL